MRFITMKRGLEFYTSLWGQKGLEINAYWNEETWNYFSFSSGWSFKGDHAGLSLSFNIWKFEFFFSAYDGRHWNWDANRYYFPGEEQAERQRLKDDDDNVEDFL
jgi:hypothetical protein